MKCGNQEEPLLSFLDTQLPTFSDVVHIYNLVTMVIEPIVAHTRHRAKYICKELSEVQVLQRFLTTSTNAP